MNSDTPIPLTEIAHPQKKPRGVLYIARQLLGGSIQLFVGTTPEGYLFAGIILLFLLMYWIADFSNAFAMMAAIMLALFFVSGTIGYLSLLKLSIGRRFPASIHAGDEVEIALRVRNRKRLIPCGAITLEEKCEAFYRPGRAFFLVVAPGGMTEAWFKAVSRRRGVFRFGETRIRSTFPLGLFRNAGIARIPGEITIYPRLGRIDQSFFYDTEKLLRRSRQARMCRAEEDFRGLREYRPGDSLRSVHWKTSARRGVLLVREYERNEDRSVTVLLDSNVDNVHLKPNDWERAISFIATLGLNATRYEFRLNVLAFGETEPLRVTVDPSRNNTSQLYEMLARLKPSDGADIEKLLMRLPHHGQMESVIFLLSPRRPAARDALANMRNITRIDPTRAEFRKIFQIQDEDKTDDSGSGTARAADDSANVSVDDVETVTILPEGDA